MVMESVMVATVSVTVAGVTVWVTQSVTVAGTIVVRKKDSQSWMREVRTGWPKRVALTCL